MELTDGRWHEDDLRRLKEFRLMDDDFLTKCFEGEISGIQLVLRVLLEKEDLKVTESRTQVFVDNLLDRSVRLDVLATDSDGRKFNIEVQRADKGAGKKRARYNSSMMDANLLEKGKDFDALPETYVIFITENDVIGWGEPLYRIERCILGSGKSFGDGSHILYVNGACRDETPVGRLMHDFACTDPEEMHYTELAERVRFFKESKEGVAVMCKAMEDMREAAWKEGLKKGQKEGLEKGREEGLEKGREEGLEKGKTDTARRMLALGKYAADEIAGISGLPLEEVLKLKKA